MLVRHDQDDNGTSRISPVQDHHHHHYTHSVSNLLQATPTVDDQRSANEELRSAFMEPNSAAGGVGRQVTLIVQASERQAGENSGRRSPDESGSEDIDDEDDEEAENGES